MASVGTTTSIEFRVTADPYQLGCFRATCGQCQEYHWDLEDPGLVRWMREHEYSHAKYQPCARCGHSADKHEGAGCRALRPDRWTNYCTCKGYQTDKQREALVEASTALQGVFPDSPLSRVVEKLLRAFN